MKSSIIWSISIFYFTLISIASAQLRTKSSAGTNLAWASQLSSLDIYYSTDVKKNFNESVTDNEIEEIFHQSFSQWNSEHESIFLNKISQDNLPSIGSSNTIRFSNDQTYLNDGVLGVTLLNFDTLSGRIFSGDILINQTDSTTVYISKDASANGAYTAYLGDILTHELGHFLGFTHNPRIGSTMYPSLINGQHTLDQGDKSGVKNMGSGTISGNIEIKNNLGVFGIPVSLFSLTEGKFVSTQLTGVDGEFNFSNATVDDVYFLYQKPNQIISNLPEYYLSVDNNFCPGEFKPSFYSSCSKRENFEPSELGLSSGTNVIDVGSFALRCSDLTGKNYLSNKLSVQENIFSDYLGAHHQGVFFEYEIEDDFASSQYDSYAFDMTNIDLSGSGDYFLLIQTLNTSLSSIVDLQVSVDINKTGSFSDYSSQVDSSLNLLETEFQTYVPLSSTIADNYIQVRITPRWLTESEYRGIFSNQKTFEKTGMQKYSLLAYIVEIDAQGNKSFSYSSVNIEGNDDCLGGIKSHQNTPNITTLDDGTSDRLRNGKSPEMFMCGTTQSFIQKTNESHSFFSIILMAILNLMMVAFGYFILNMIYRMKMLYRRFSL